MYASIYWLIDVFLLLLVVFLNKHIASIKDNESINLVY